jgi:hypothetical protein
MTGGDEDVREEQKINEERSRRVVEEGKPGKKCNFKESGKWEMEVDKGRVQNANEFKSIIFHHIAPEWRENPCTYFKREAYPLAALPKVDIKHVLHNC